MANNEDNIKEHSFDKLTAERQREIASMGGKASAEARKERKAMKEQIELLLSLPLQDEKAKAQFQRMGIDIENINNQMAMIVKVFQTALGGGKNQISAATFLRDTVGEKPKEVVEVSKTTDETIKEVEDYLSSKKEVGNNE